MASHNFVVPRFERFILTFGSCPDCLVLDDEFSVLPISREKNIIPIEPPPQKKREGKIYRYSTQGLEWLSIRHKARWGLSQACENDWSSAVSADSHRSYRWENCLRPWLWLPPVEEVRVLPLGWQLQLSCSNTLWQVRVRNFLFGFIFTGMDALGWRAFRLWHCAEYKNPDFNKAIVRVNVFRDHRQTIQVRSCKNQSYSFLNMIFSTSNQKMLMSLDRLNWSSSTKPLQFPVQNLIGPYLVFLASTISNCYEGTGRSPSLKLIQQLRESSKPSSSKKPIAKAPPKVRTLREIKLKSRSVIRSATKLKNGSTTSFALTLRSHINHPAHKVS